jgi:hypothetical protein
VRDKQDRFKQRTNARRPPLTILRELSCIYDGDNPQYACFVLPRSAATISSVPREKELRINREIDRCFVYVKRFFYLNVYFNRVAILPSSGIIRDHAIREPTVRYCDDQSYLENRV